MMKIFLLIKLLSYSIVELWELPIIKNILTILNEVVKDGIQNKYQIYDDENI